jgi:hypothetical protein
MRRAPVEGDLDGLGEHAAGLALTPVRVEQIDVEREHHARLEAVANHLDRLAVGRDGVMAEARIFERCQSVPVDARFADRKAARVDLVLDRHERGRDRLARPEMLQSAAVGGEASLVDVQLLFLGLAQAVGAFDMGEVAAELRVLSQMMRSPFSMARVGRHAEGMR